MKNAINVVSAGKQVKSLEILLATAQWWIVWLKCVGDPLGAVYIGPPWTIKRWIAYHQEHFGDAELLTAHPFDDREAYLGAVLPLEREFAEYLKNKENRNDAHQGRDQRQGRCRAVHCGAGRPVGAA